MVASQPEYMKTAMSRPAARLPFPPMPDRLNQLLVIGKVPAWWPSTYTSPQIETPMRMMYSNTAMTTWVRAVIRMPATAIASMTMMRMVLMPMLGHALEAVALKTASTAGERTTTTEIVPTM